MLSVIEFIEKLNEIKDGRLSDLIYIYCENEDRYYTIKDIRIDSENDIVVDLDDSNHG